MKEFIKAFPKIALTQLVAVVLIIIMVISVKFFFESEYKAIKSFYLNEILSEVSVSEVLKE